MNAAIYEIPTRLARLLKTIGPIHEAACGDYSFAIRLVLTDDNAPAGFVVEQRIAERSAPAAEGQGMSFKVPLKPDVRNEPTFVFVESLSDALDYTRHQTTPEAS